MADYPLAGLEFPVGACIHSGHPAVSTCNQAELSVVNYTASAWPGANVAIYIPFTLDTTQIAKQMFWENGVAGGNTDIGIYDVNYKLLVSRGSVVNAGTVQIEDITDTELLPGAYYMAMLGSTTATRWNAFVSAATLRMCGVTRQAVGAGTLPNPGVPAASVNAYLPFMGISFQAVM